MTNAAPHFSTNGRPKLMTAGKTATRGGTLIQTCKHCGKKFGTSKPLAYCSQSCVGRANGPTNLSKRRTPAKSAGQVFAEMQSMFGAQQ